MSVPVLDPSAEGVSLMELVKLSAMMAGAVSGAIVAWIARRNALLVLYAFLLGMMGGILLGTGMGNLLYVTHEGAESFVKAAVSSLIPVLGAGAAGALPTAFVMSIIVGFILLRHLHPRPPRVRTALKGFFVGAVMGTLTAVIWTVI